MDLISNNYKLKGNIQILVHHICNFCLVWDNKSKSIILGVRTKDVCWLTSELQHFLRWFRGYSFGESFLMRFKRFFMIFSEYACLEMSILFSLAFACTNKKEPIIKSNILNLLFIIFKNLCEMIDYYSNIVKWSITQ
jgi:hypothetical protein